MRFVVLAYGPPPAEGILLGPAETATHVRDGELVFDEVASPVTGLRLVDASSLDAVLDVLPPTGSFEIRPAGIP